MNEDFIYKALPPVPDGLAERLYDRLSAGEEPIRRRPFIRTPTTRPQWQAVAIILGVLLVVAWTQVALRVRYVRIGDLFLVEIGRLAELVTPSEATLPIPTPGQLPTPKDSVFQCSGCKEWEIVALAPMWIPAGFSSVDIPSEMTAYETTIGLWSNESGQRIRLFMTPQAEGMHPFAPPGEYEEVAVNGKPAILIHGRYTPTSSADPQAHRAWSEELGLQLAWAGDFPSIRNPAIRVGSVYTLETFGLYLTSEDLIKMAESMVRNWDFRPH